MEISDLPTVNALLNSTSAILIVAGYIFVRRGEIKRHKTCMLAAVATSALFLISYLIYHYYAGSRSFAGVGWSRTIYLVILISHSILAAAVLPLVLVTVVRALRADYDAHRKIARWTFPVWLYVSVTGVLVYLMLYHWT
ncbi:MAG TPA: DUF420 domain-containing protein [Acidobacteriota bacterium]|nr:DUF420 domain-containing protein [Acidobacteriota bacterium]